MTKRIVGLMAGAPELPSDARTVLVAALARERTVFICDPESQLKGPRFSDDEKTSWAIRGTYSAEEVRTNPDDAARAGLKWAAETDWFYKNEKRWD